MRRARPKRIAAGGRSYHWTMRAHGAGRDDPGIEPGTREMTSSAFTPLRLGPLTLRNRFIKSATNEGMAPGGDISKLHPGSIKALMTTKFGNDGDRRGDNVLVKGQYLRVFDMADPVHVSAGRVRSSPSDRH